MRSQNRDDTSPVDGTPTTATDSHRDSVVIPVQRSGAPYFTAKDYDDAVELNRVPSSDPPPQRSRHDSATPPPPPPGVPARRVVEIARAADLDDSGGDDGLINSPAPSNGAQLWIPAVADTTPWSPQPPTAAASHGADSVDSGGPPDAGLSRHTSGVSSRYGNGSSDTDASTNVTGGTGQMAKAAGMSTIRCGGLKIRVPFTAWTFLAMLVPIGLLVAVLSIELAATVNELNLVDEHKALATAVGECSSWLMRERGTMGPWIARGSDADWTNLQRVRAGVDTHCGDGLAGEMRKLSSESATWSGEIRRHVRLLQNLATWRERVNTRVVDGRAAREFFTASIAESAESLIIVVDMLQMTERAFSELRLTIGARNYIGLARGVGNAIAASDPNATTGSSAVVHEYIAGHAQSRLGYAFLRGMAAPTLRAKLSGWEQSSEAQRMWLLLDTMADVSNGGVRSIQQNNATEWWAVVSAGLDALYAVEQAHLAELHRATAAKASVRDSALIMALGVAACLAAAGLLAWRQTQVRQQLEDQVARVQKTKKAVSAFVPRFFLQKMGYTSITQVRAGESTNVALAMLFSDIRRFTTVSEGMESSELFDWIQGYFRRMTTIVEGRRGNVNQFVGDAMFAVFGTCNDALQCAVDMQADVQQLNVQRLRSDESIIPIEVGVGIHHDVVALGILGDSKRHTCTAISASVNLASRLEGLTKQLGCNIIASEAVVAQLSVAEASCLRMRRVGPVVVKGSGAPVVVHDVFHADPRALQLYKSASREAFEAVARACLAHDPGPEVQAHLQRELRACVVVSDNRSRTSAAAPTDPPSHPGLHTPLHQRASLPPCHNGLMNNSVASAVDVFAESGGQTPHYGLSIVSPPVAAAAAAAAAIGRSPMIATPLTQRSGKQTSQGQLVRPSSLAATPEALAAHDDGPVGSRLYAATGAAASPAPTPHNASTASPRALIDDLILPEAAVHAVASPVAAAAAFAPPSSAEVGEGRVSTRALIEPLIEQLQQHGVRDYAVEAIAVLADGSGTLHFVNK